MYENPQIEEPFPGEKSGEKINQLPDADVLGTPESGSAIIFTDPDLSINKAKQFV